MSLTLCPKGYRSRLQLSVKLSGYTIDYYQFNLTEPLEIIDRRASYYHLSRSAFLAEAAIKFGKAVENEYAFDVSAEL